MGVHGISGSCRRPDCGTPWRSGLVCEPCRAAISAHGHRSAADGQSLAESSDVRLRAAVHRGGVRPPVVVVGQRPRRECAPTSSLPIGARHNRPRSGNLCVMPLVLVTGISGSGKSTVCSELQARCYEAHDTDQHANAVWVRRATGEIAATQSGPEMRSPDWLAQHEWTMARDRIEALAERAGSRTVFLCGMTKNSPRCPTSSRGSSFSRLTLRHFDVVWRRGRRTILARHRMSWLRSRNGTASPKTNIASTAQSSSTPRAPCAK